MASFQKFNSFVQDLGTKSMNLSSDTLKIMLTLTAPVSTNAVKADLTEISAGNGYTAGGTAVTSQTWTNASGTSKLNGADVTFTASGGDIGPFRYAVLYDDTATGDPLIGFWDYGGSLTLGSGSSFLVDFNATNGILQLV